MKQAGRGGVARVREERLPGPVPAYAHPGWQTRFPWLAQGTTGRGGDVAFDLGLRGAAPVGAAMERWQSLGAALGFARMAHAHQVHGARILAHDGGAPGLLLSDACDGHVTATPGILLTVSVADCVPVFLVDARRRAVALLHAGWRGVAAGMLEAGVRSLGERFGSVAEDLHVHLGPSICGRCYEVGPEVFRALGREPPSRPTPIDLAGELAQRARAAGVPADRISASTRCTRCDASDFFSHRAHVAGAGPAGHQVGFLGIRTGGKATARVDRIP